MPIWAYHLAEFRLVDDYDFNNTVNELTCITINEAEKRSIKPDTA